MDRVSFSTLLPDKEVQDECDIFLSEEKKRNTTRLTLARTS